MNNTEDLKALIDSFLAYRNILVPLQESLHSAVESYGSIKDDISRLEQTFGGQTKAQLDKIYLTINQQARSSAEMSEKIDKFVAGIDRYTKMMADTNEKFSNIEEKLLTINAIEKNAEEQIQRLDAIINEKKINYNIKDLQKTLESYNKNVERVSDFINKDVAKVLQDNGKKIDEIKRDNELLSESLKSQGQTVDSLISAFRETNSLLRKSIESEDVNESYIFDILDKWASSRRVKIKPDEYNAKRNGKNKKDK